MQHSRLKSEKRCNLGKPHCLPQEQRYFLNFFKRCSSEGASNRVKTFFSKNIDFSIWGKQQCNHSYTHLLFCTIFPFLEQDKLKTGREQQRPQQYPLLKCGEATVVNLVIKKDMKFRNWGGQTERELSQASLTDWLAKRGQGGGSTAKYSTADPPSYQPPPLVVVVLGWVYIDSA